MARLCRIREVWVFPADGRCEEAGVCGPSLEDEDPGTCSRSHLRLPGVLWGGQAARPSPGQQGSGWRAGRSEWDKFALGRKSPHGVLGTLTESRKARRGGRRRLRKQQPPSAPSCASERAGNGAQRGWDGPASRSSSPRPGGAWSRGAGLPPPLPLDRPPEPAPVGSRMCPEALCLPGPRPGWELVGGPRVPLSPFRNSPSSVCRASWERVWGVIEGPGVPGAGDGARTPRTAVHTARAQAPCQVLRTQG